MSGPRLDDDSIAAAAVASSLLASGLPPAATASTAHQHRSSMPAAPRSSIVGGGHGNAAHSSLATAPVYGDGGASHSAVLSATAIAQLAAEALARRRSDWEDDDEDDGDAMAQESYDVDEDDEDEPNADVAAVLAKKTATQQHKADFKDKVCYCIVCSHVWYCPCFAHSSCFLCWSCFSVERTMTNSPPCVLPCAAVRRPMRMRTRTRTTRAVSSLPQLTREAWLPTFD